MLRKIKNNKGFTLVELIVVIVIILVLSALLVPSVNRYIKQARKAVCANQRQEMKMQFQLMGADHPELGELKDTTELDQLLGGKTITQYMVENGYCAKSTVTCPVYDVEYEIDLGEVDGYQEVEFVCPCTDSVKGYLALSNKIYKGGNQYISREELMKKVIKENGSLLKVADSTVGKSVFSNKELYWRPYYLKSGKEPAKMIMYASTYNPNGNAWQNWEGYLLYVDGKVYQSTKKNGATPTNTNIADLSKVAPSEIDDYLKNKGFEEIQ